MRVSGADGACEYFGPGGFITDDAGSIEADGDSSFKGFPGCCYGRTSGPGRDQVALSQPFPQLKHTSSLLIATAPHY